MVANDTVVHEFGMVLQAAQRRRAAAAGLSSHSGGAGGDGSSGGSNLDAGAPAGVSRDALPAAAADTTTVAAAAAAAGQLPTLEAGRSVLAAPLHARDAALGAATGGGGAPPVAQRDDSIRAQRSRVQPAQQQQLAVAPRGDQLRARCQRRVRDARTACRGCGSEGGVLSRALKSTAAPHPSFTPPRKTTN